MFRYLLLIGIFPIIILAQSDNVQFDYISVEDGLSYSFVTCFTQDSTGFIWIGTENGLNRYDGYNFTTYKHNPYDTIGISDNIITALCVDRFGFLWIGTGNGGLNRYDPKKNSFIRFKHNAGNPECLSSNNILSVCQDMCGDIWIGTDRGGLNILQNHGDSLNQDSCSFIKYSYEPGMENCIAGNSINCKSSKTLGLKIRFC